MKRKYIIILIALLTLGWVAVHIPGIVFGTSQTPLHISYLTADEQLPVNGALHMLESKSLLGVRDSVNYYGPVFAVIAVPAVLADFAWRLVSGAVSGLGSYKDFIVWNWGGILVWARVIATLVGLLGLLAVYRMFQTSTLNPAQKAWVPRVAVALLGLNFMYFEYADFFRHWIFIIVIALWQMYLIILMMEKPEKRHRYWMWQALLTAASFGVSYFGMAYEIIWLPVLVVWFRQKDWKALKEFGVYVLAVVVLMALIVVWYPYPFERMLSVAGLIGTFTRVGPVMDLTSAPASSSSFLFYLEVIVINNLLSICAVIVLLYALIRQRLHARYWLWVFALPALLNLAIFSIPAHHESRYALPTVVFGILALVGMFAMRAGESFESRTPVRVASWLIGISIILNCIQIIGWQRMIWAGPPERQLIVPQVISWQKENPQSKTLVYLSWPLGYVHTHVAYEDFVANHGKGASDLWQYILTLPPPADVTPINVYYRNESTSTAASDLKKYDHVVAYEPAPLDPLVWNGSPNDQFDLRPWTVWDFERYQQTYKIIK